MVDPPKAVIKTIAFSNDFLDIISRGFKSNSIRFFIAPPILSISFNFSLETAGVEELFGKVNPITSMAEAMVFAVYIPPQAPAPGQAFLIIQSKSFFFNFPETCSPQASNAETMSSFFDLYFPEAMVPP